jgi:exosortase A-associated hydrolase 2
VSIERSAFFLETPRGRRFCLDTLPSQPVVGAMLYFPPFAEELNKSRRMAALAARAFAAHGWRVLQPDVHGCGDSEGDFGAADWQGWCDDMEDAWRWLTARTPGRRVWWSLRAGSLLVTECLRRAASCQTGQTVPPELLLWQPVLDGERHLHQFLRLETARHMLAESDARAAAAGLRAALERGEAVEVAGYTLNPALARGLAGARFELINPIPNHTTVGAGFKPAHRPTCTVNGGTVNMIEVGRQEGAASPAFAAFAASAAGVHLHQVPGAAFWQTQEIAEVPTLIEKSLAVLERPCP